MYTFVLNEGRQVEKGESAQRDGTQRGLVGYQSVSTPPRHQTSDGLSTLQRWGRFWLDLALVGSFSTPAVTLICDRCRGP
jgi:hypothetical protein